MNRLLMISASALMLTAFGDADARDHSRDARYEAGRVAQQARHAEPRHGNRNGRSEQGFRTLRDRVEYPRQQHRNEGYRGGQRHQQNSGFQDQRHQRGSRHGNDRDYNNRHRNYDRPHYNHSPRGDRGRYGHNNQPRRHHGWRDHGRQNHGWKNRGWRHNDWRRNWHHGWSGQRYRTVDRYYYPRGYAARAWQIGFRLPHAYLSANYYVDYRPYGLAVPPYGCRWLRVGSDLLLVELISGEIVDILYSFYY